MNTKGSIAFLVAVAFGQAWSSAEVSQPHPADCAADATPASALLQVRKEQAHRVNLNADPTVLSKDEIREELLSEKEDVNATGKMSVQPGSKWAQFHLAHKADAFEGLNASAARTRVEMAKRALAIADSDVDDEEAPAEEEVAEFGVKEEDLFTKAEEEGKASPAKAGREKASVGVKVDQPEDVVHQDVITGGTATLDEKGFQHVASICCPLEMSIYAERLITHYGYKVCNEGSLQGLVSWYYCANQTRTFAELLDETMDAGDGDCAWVGTESACPTMSENCPSFPDTSGHRRRTCRQRHVSNVTTTPIPSTTDYEVEASTHCGYYQSCGELENALYLGEDNQTWSKSTDPNIDCVPVCDSASACAGFTFSHASSRCYYRKNVTCGVFESEDNDCWSKP